MKVMKQITPSVQPRLKAIPAAKDQRNKWTTTTHKFTDFNITF